VLVGAAGTVVAITAIGPLIGNSACTLVGFALQQAQNKVLGASLRHGPAACNPGGCTAILLHCTAALYCQSCRYISEDFGGVALHPVDILDASSGRLLAALVDGHLETITPVNLPHPRLDIIISGSSRWLWGSV
jgi:hypothetical protein